MRGESEVAQFAASMGEQFGEDDPTGDYYTQCYEAGVPRTFWDIRRDDVRYNVEPFRSVVCRYVARRRRALRHGYSLLLLGDNGCGKTMFMAYVLTQVIRRGNTAYYTTLAQLDVDIKRGFKDGEAEGRLNDLLGSDFVAIDEIGKEHYRADSYLNTRLELLMKQRYDDGEPMLMGTNLDFGTLCEMYGASMTSMWEGKYQRVTLESGDFRRSVSSKMRRDMGYGS